VRSARQSGVPAVQWLVVTSASGQRSCGAPDSPVPHTGWSGAPTEVETNQSGDSLPHLARILFTVWCAPDNPVRQQTEGNRDLPNGAPTAPSSLRAIKGTPRHMEQNTKPPLNILQRLDFASTHWIHCDWDLRTSLSYDSVALFRVLVSWLVCVLLLRFLFLCVFLFPPLLLWFLWSIL
jgi:hypothetical protein